MTLGNYSPTGINEMPCFSRLIYLYLNMSDKHLIVLIKARFMASGDLLARQLFDIAAISWEVAEARFLTSHRSIIAMREYSVRMSAYSLEQKNDWPLSIFILLSKKKIYYIGPIPKF